MRETAQEQTLRKCVIFLKQIVIAIETRNTQK